MTLKLLFYLICSSSQRITNENSSRSRFYLLAILGDSMRTISHSDLSQSEGRLLQTLYLPCTQTQQRLSVQFYTKCFLLQEICKSAFDEIFLVGEGAAKYLIYYYKLSFFLCVLLYRIYQARKNVSHLLRFYWQQMLEIEMFYNLNTVSASDFLISFLEHSFLCIFSPLLSLFLPRRFRYSVVNFCFPFFPFLFSF